MDMACRDINICSTIYLLISYDFVLTTKKISKSKYLAMAQLAKKGDYP
jgi:hypothetical protein